MDKTTQYLLEWERFAPEKEQENLMFIRGMKMFTQEQIDPIASAAHDKVFGELDCLKCGNCCKTMDLSVSEADIQRLSKHLNMSVEEFWSTYELSKNKWGDIIVKSRPCPFLGENNKCEVYEVRPQECQNYPYTNRGKFAARSYGHSANSTKCPAVFHILEEMRIRLKEQPPELSL